MWPVRHEVMYPEKSFDSIKLPEDDTALHLALYANENLISVVSLFRKENELQFRKFATIEKHQGKGYGSRLLDHVIHWAQQNGFTRIWCNARKSAAPFYNKFGFQETDYVFKKDGIEFVVMERNN